MSARDILTLNRPLAPRLIQILYWIGLLLITLGVLHGIAGGVRTMMRPMHVPMHMAAAAPGAMAPPNAMAPAASAPTQAAPSPRRGPGFGSRRFDGPRFGARHFGGHRFGWRRSHGFMMGAMMRGMPPAALGGLRILFALIQGLIAIMIIRVLAEIAAAILAMGAKAR